MAPDSDLSNTLSNASLLLKVIELSAITYPILVCAYNIYFHPLKSFPGPRLNAASIFPKIYWLQKGRLPFYITDLHAQYGRVVRIAPDELAFTEPQAWKDIYARKGSGRFESPMDQDFYNPSGVENPSLLGCLRQEHDGIRRLISNGFSDRAMKSQEPVTGRYVDTLIERLEAESSNSEPTNMRDWFAWTTFDIIGNLTFGSDFGCLQNSTYHPWVGLIMGNIKNLSALYVLKRLRIFPFAQSLMRMFKLGAKQRKMHIEHTEAKTKQRVAKGTGHSDFSDGMIKSDLVGFDQLMRNTGLFVVAGSETTATLLTGCLFYITRRSNKNVMENSKRRSGAVAGTAPRRVGPGGAHIAGHHVPDDTVVGVWQYATYHDPELFNDLDTFDPERFFDRSGKSKYINDQLDAMKPFHKGPRDCLGQNLAIAEMRLILAKLTWTFDVELSASIEGWLEKQENYLMWDKPDLNVHLRSARR